MSLDLGALVAHATIEDIGFQRTYVRLVRQFADLGAKATATATGTDRLDKSLAAAATAGTAASTGLGRAEKAMAGAGVSASTAAAATQAAAAASNELQIAELRLVAAQDRLAAVQKTGTATAGQLAAAQAAVLRAEQSLSTVQTRLATQTAREADTAAAAAAAQARHAAAVDRVQAVTGRTAAAQLRLIAAQERLDTLMASGTATAGRLAAAEASVARASEALAAAQAATAGGIGAARTASVGFVRDMGKQLGVLSAVLAVFKGFKIGIDYQDELNTFQAVTEATAEQMDAAAAKAKELGNDLTLPAVSAADAARAMTELAKGGLSVNEALAAAQGTMRLATAANLDAAQAAQIQANALNQFGLQASAANHMADVLANTAAAASGEVTDMALALSYFGPVARAVGAPVDDVATAVGLLAKNGTLSQKAGTGLRAVLASLANPSDKAAAGLRKLNIEAFDQQGNFVGLRKITEQLALAKDHLSQKEYLAAAAAAFGREPLAVINELASEGAGAWDEMADKVGRAGGAEDLAAAKSRGLGGALRGLSSQLETIAISAYTRVAPGLEGVARTGSGVLDMAMDVGGALDHVLAPALGGIVEVGVDVVKFFLTNQAAASALATVLIAKLLPAALTTGKALAWGFLERVAAGILAVVTGATTLTGTLRALGASGLIAKAGLLAVLYVLTNVVTDFIRGDEAIKRFRDRLDQPIQTTFLTDLQDNVAGLQDDWARLNQEGFNFGSMMAWVTHPVRTFHDAVGDTAEELNRLSEQVTGQVLGNFHDLVVALHDWPTPDAQEQTVRVLAAMGVTAEELGSTDFPVLLARVQDWIAANRASKNPVQAAGEAINRLGSDANSAADDVQDLTAALDLLAGDALSADQAAIAFRNDIVTLDKALKHSKGSLDLNTKAGREARDAFDQAAQQALNHAEAQAKLKDGTDKARDTLRREIDILKDHAGDSDYAARMVAKLRDALHSLPHEVKVKANADQAISTFDRVLWYLNQIHDENVDVTVRELRVQQGPGGVLRRAFGGPVPGSGGIDSVNMKATPGEFVVRKDGSNLDDAYRFYGRPKPNGMDTPQIIINNPVPEKASVSIPRALAEAQYVYGWTS